ncbi:hypothetical protein TNCV_1643331 [Trichonephila clavipes]|nr:hypothetical protein TNCV_1643331 [Trichonephila clavipes]
MSSSRWGWTTAADNAAQQDAGVELGIALQLLIRYHAHSFAAARHSLPLPPAFLSAKPPYNHHTHCEQTAAIKWAHP